MRDEILRGVAMNAGAPVDVLLRLLAVEAHACWDALCTERDLPTELVDAILAHPDHQVRRRIAGNPHLDPAQRARLIDDPDPKTAAAALLRGPRQWPAGTSPRPLPDDVLRRLLASPPPIMTYRDVLEELTFTHFGRLACEIAATHPLPEVRAEACDHRRALSGEQWLALQRDPDPQVRAAAAEAVAYDAVVIEPADLPPYRGHYHWLLLQTRRLSRAALDQLTADLDNLAFLSYNPYLPPDLVEALVSHPDAGIRGTATRRDDLTADQLARLAVDVDASVRIAVSTHRGLTESQRAAIAVERWPRDSFDRLKPGLMPELAVSIADAYSVNPLLRRSAAREPRLPQAVAQRLAEDPDPGVRVRLALCHPAPPPALLLRCYLEYDGPDRLHLTTLPGFPVTGLARLARDPDPAVRLLALLDPEVPEDVVDGFLTDPDHQVATAAILHPRLPADRLRELLDTERAPLAAANPTLDAATLHELLDAAGIPGATR
ncbi:translation initiation factor 2 [Catellatospora vulcania]|uniref:translation initiation factor 2 n=1 Tax=Catellatospora vulcania TaxID=1460450 RepID=UPI0018AF58C3|nr:translation initiation factor 2 [Catellatospora vulcania]